MYAQHTPRAEVFGGYSNLRIDTQGLSGATLANACNVIFGDGTCPPGSVGVNSNFHGWNAAIQMNPNRWLGFKADFSGHYGTPITISSALQSDLNDRGIRGLPPKANSFSYLLGPSLSHRFSNYTIFGHALFGANRAGVNVDVRINGLQLPALTVSNTALGMAFGGGIDTRISTHFAVRGQADYLYTRHDFTSILPSIAAHQNNVRVSAGIVYRFGGTVGRTTQQQPAHETSPRTYNVPSTRHGLPISALGLTANPVDAGGAQVASVIPGSAAEMSGLHVGDVISSVDDKPIKSPMELASELSDRVPGSKVKIGYLVKGYWHSETTVLVGGQH
jgi:opacity protein-like surface antigen